MPLTAAITTIRLPHLQGHAPFGYFCDDLLGMWILTYFWFTQPPNTTDPSLAPIYQAIGAKNGFNNRTELPLS